MSKQKGQTMKTAPKTINNLADILEQRSGMDRSTAIYITSHFLMAGCGSAVQFKPPGESLQPIKVKALSIRPDHGPDINLALARGLMKMTLENQKGYLRVRKTLSVEQLLQLRKAAGDLYRYDLGLLEGFQMKLSEMTRKSLSGEERDNPEYKAMLEEYQTATQLVKNSGIENGQTIMSLHPITMPPCISPQWIKDEESWGFDGSYMVMADGATALRYASAKRRSDRQPVLDYLSKDGGWDAGVKFVEGNPPQQTQSLNCLLSFTRSQLADHLLSPDLSGTGFLENSLVLPTPATQKLDLPLTEDLKKLMTMLTETRIKRVQRSVLKNVEKDVLGACTKLWDQLPAVDAPSVTERMRHHLVTRAVHLAASWATFPGKHPQSIAAEGIFEAFEVVQDIFEQSLPVVLHSLVLPPERDDIEERIRVMIGKVRQKGRIKRWDLFRSYNDQRRQVHQPTLEKAVEIGALQIQDDFVSLAPGLSGSFSGSVGFSDQNVRTNPDVKSSESSAQEGDAA